MKTITTSLFVALFSLSAFAHDLDYGTYLKLQESLAADNFSSALAAHKEICDKELIHYKDDYKDCDKKFASIDELRESFKKLSAVFIENGDKKQLKGLQKMNCSMAKADWVQKEGAVANPYYGKSMLRCGEKQ